MKWINERVGITWWDYQAYQSTLSGPPDDHMSKSAEAYQLPVKSTEIVTVQIWYLRRNRWMDVFITPIYRKEVCVCACVSLVWSHALTNPPSLHPVNTADNWAKSYPYKSLNQNCCITDTNQGAGLYFILSLFIFYLLVTQKRIFLSPWLGISISF